MVVVKKAVLASLVVLATSVSVAQAAGGGSGVVNFKGDILKAACSIPPESSNRDVNFGQVALAQLSAGGKSDPKSIEIDLVGCDLTDLKDNTVAATFTGAESAAVPGALGITGTAQGAGIMLVEGSGKAIALGTPTTPQGLIAGNNKLNFSAYLQGQATGDVTPGSFNSVASFALTYQ